MTLQFSSQADFLLSVWYEEYTRATSSDSYFYILGGGTSFVTLLPKHEEA